MRQRRLKLRDKQGELRQDWEANYGTYEHALDEWIDDRIPPAPEGLLCEAQRCVQLRLCDDQEGSLFCHLDYGHEDDCKHTAFMTPEPRHLAESYLYVVKDGHVCYTYVCYECCESCVGDMDGVDPGDYPVTDAGYAVAPTRCS